MTAATRSVLPARAIGFEADITLGAEAGHSGHGTIDLHAHTKQLTLGGVTASLHGYLLHRPFDTNFVRECIDDPVSAAQTVDGTFTILLWDATRSVLTLITDILGSQPTWVHAGGPGRRRIRLFSALEQVPADLRLPDWIGVGWALANGVVHGHRSIFRNVEPVGPARVVTITPGERHEQRYWRAEFTADNANRDERDLRTEFADILREAMRVRMRPGPALITLTGGVDSRSIAAFASQLAHDPDDLTAVTYELSQRPASDPTDGNIGALVAAACCLRHVREPSFDGDIDGLLAANGVWGNGATNHCDELQVYPSLAGRYGRDIPFFVGEQCLYGYHGGTTTGILEPTFVRDASGLRYLRGGPLGDLIDEMVEGVAADCDALRGGLTGDTDAMKRDQLYVEARLGNLIMPWRAMFAGREFVVMNPWLDRHVMEFTMSLSDDQRHDKRLYEDTCRELFPDAYAPIRSTIGNYEPHYPPLLRAAIDRLEAPGSSDGALADAWRTADLRQVLASNVGRLDDSRLNKARRALRIWGRHQKQLGHIANVPFLRPHTPFDRLALKLFGLLHAIERTED